MTPPDDDLLVAERPGTAAPGPPDPGGGAHRSDVGSLVRLLLVLSAIVALFVVAGLGDLLIVLVAIIVMVMVHELGHFATAKWSHMKVTQYFVGFGPPLWSIKRGETEYGVKPILAGGYVKIPGMTNMEEVDPADEYRTYRQQPFHNRIIVASAGSFMHFVMALALAWVAVIAFGVPSDNVSIAAFTSWAGQAANAAQQAGLHKGDVIDSVDGRRLTGPDQLETAIAGSSGRPVVLGVQRGSERLRITVTPRDGRTIRSDGRLLTPASDPAHGYIGVDLTSATTSEGPFRAIGTAASDVGSITAATFAGLGHLFSPHGLDSLFTQVTSSHAAEQAASHPATSTRPMSIVGAVRVATQAYQTGVLYLIDILIALNIVIAIVNMLPMLPLDGGHVAIAVYERIRTRKGQPYYQADAAKLLPVVYAFVLVLGLVVVSAVFLDIAHPAANPFH